MRGVRRSFDAEAAPVRALRGLKTLADVFAYAVSQGVRLRVDGTGVQVRRPSASRPGRRAFVSGKKEAEHHQGHRD